MKKIGIITITDYNNYGNRLQNYAVQEVLRSLGVYPETIKTAHPSLEVNKVNNISIIKKEKNKSLSEISKKLRKKVEAVMNKKYYTCKTENFLEFSKKYILETDYFIDKDNIPDDLSDSYDYFIIGSDQIWNPTFRYGSFIDFATFAPPNKRISYSASFGTSLIPDTYKNDYSKWLSGINSLSVREEAGAQIVKDLTNREAIVLVDPTLMLNKEEWLKISSADKFKPRERFLLTYILGQISEEQKLYIKKISEDKSIKIVNLADIVDRKRYTAGPSEFIDYISSSELIITDSFHGTIFSILFEKPFITFNRNIEGLSMDSRIDTLLKKFNLESRRWNNMKKEKEVYNINFSHIPVILEYERRRAIDFLKNSMNIKDE